MVWAIFFIPLDGFSEDCLSRNMTFPDYLCASLFGSGTHVQECELNLFH